MKSTIKETDSVCSSYSTSLFNCVKVSVVVITYNSSKYVLDTLESVKSQDYTNIELIISDDCSTDDTFLICKRWIAQNQDRFTRVLAVQTDKNGGICANYNRGLKEVQGEWVKYIAGDDILLPNCISTFVSFTRECCDKIMISGTVHFSESNVNEEKIMLPLSFGELKASKQEKYLVRNGTVIEGPTLFLETATLRELNGFEECYPFIEDYPLCMKYLSKGYHIQLVHSHLIRYRVYNESVSRGDSRFEVSIFNAIDYYAPKAAWRRGMLFWWYHHKVNAVVRHLPYNRKWLGYVLRSVDFINYMNKFFR